MNIAPGTSLGGSIGGSTEDEDLDHGPDLDSIISSAMSSAGIEGVAAPAEPATDTAQDGRTRDASGRFSSTTTASDALTGQEPAAVVANPASPEGTPPVAQATLDAPARWSEADKAAFKAWPADAQKQILDRHSAMEADHTRKTQEIAAFRQSAEPLVSAVQPHAEYLQQLGLRPDQAVGQLLMAERSLRLGSPEQKVQALAGLAQQYGIDLRAAATNTAPDPVLSQVHQQGQQFDQRLRTIEAARQAEVQRATEDAHSSAVSNVAAFQAAQNADGSLKHPHFDAVRGAMQHLLADGRAATIDEAYALAAAPITAAVEAERTRLEGARTQQRQQQVDRAKRAAPALPSAGTNPGRAQPQSLDDIVRGAMAGAGLPTI